jgi:rSAM/selenodomain-associated transferase 1
MRKAIIIFVRNPEPGKVKTRLAKEIGDEQTLRVYSDLLQHTHDITGNLDCDKFVFYADYINNDDLWERENFEKKLQEGENLGNRMIVAFFELFQLGYSKVVIIGSDCTELTTFIIEDAFDQLDATDVVIGPASDGGYYLLGLTHLVPELFNNKQWSTDTVLADTIKDTVNLQKSCSFLTELSDIDTVEDLRRHQEMLKA